MATLYVLSGLPGTGKSTLARGLCRALGATWLRVDTLEDALHDLLDLAPGPEGYVLAQRIAADNLSLGQSVVADCCNPVPASRDAWAEVARAATSELVELEVVCTDLAEHERRVVERARHDPRLSQPAWPAVQRRTRVPWDRPVLRIDTAEATPAQSLRELLERLETRSGSTA